MVFESDHTSGTFTYKSGAKTITQGQTLTLVTYEKLTKNSMLIDYHDFI